MRAGRIVSAIAIDALENRTIEALYDLEPLILGHRITGDSARRYFFLRDGDLGQTEMRVGGD
ncbi:hypothetical protein EA473_06200 [Natrarchaeobius chitinivorans]|uniref:Uncharacterized protein n=1 Tax=Natrarchaeobius chitinivorans TaxID=1679083 RepID=A0A3N6LY95_NATCH|nr:hypothetical protein EA473_06200 [Natrarchaeobius chitinivorans]